jgi:hypothetical protein
MDFLPQQLSAHCIFLYQMGTSNKAEMIRASLASLDSLNFRMHLIASDLSEIRVHVS